MNGLSCDNQSWIGEASLLTLTAYIILYYDYFLTLSKEVDGFWYAGSHTWASILFLVNRYMALLGHAPLLYVIFWDPCQMKSIELLLNMYHSILILVLTFLTQVLLIMRVYALYYRNKWILSVLMLEIAAGLLVACWCLVRIVHGVGGEALEPGKPRPSHLIAVAYMGLLIVDFTVFVLTIARSIRLWTHREPFLHRLFIDGFLYYGVIWNLNLANIIVLVVKPSNRLGTPIVTNVLSVVMISRLMINLREPTLHRPADCDGTVTTSHAGYVSTVAFEEIILTPNTIGPLPESNQ